MQKTLEQLDNMTTPRLLNYYRTIRWSYKSDDAPKNQFSYIQKVKLVLDERENVPLKRGGLKVNRNTKDPKHRLPESMYDPFNGRWDLWYERNDIV